MIAEFNQCCICKHEREFGCDAYLDGIPYDLAADIHDHRQPYPGDHGIRWEPKDAGGKHPLDE